MLLNFVIKKLYWIAYRGHLLLNFLLRPNSQGVYVIILYQDKILLIKNSYKSVYTVPCGGIDKKETPLQAAQREVSEEVGIQLSLDDFQFVSKTLNYSEYKRDNIYWYQVEAPKLYKPTVDNREVVWAGFVTLEKALAMPLFPALKRFLLEAIKKIPSE